MNKDLRVLSTGERLWLWRRHRGLTILEAAARFEVGKNRLGDLEREARDDWAFSGVGFEADQVTASDLLRLARRRSGIDLPAISNRLGVSRMTVLAWESTCDSRLVAFWRRRGFRNL